MVNTLQSDEEMAALSSSLDEPLEFRSPTRAERREILAVAEMLKNGKPVPAEVVYASLRLTISAGQWQRDLESRITPDQARELLRKRAEEISSSSTKIHKTNEQRQHQHRHPKQQRSNTD